MGFLDLIRDRGRPKDPREADALALRHLQGRGADLALARHVIHFLYFEGADDARAAADAAEGAGWSTDLDPPGENVTMWTLKADGTRVLNPGTIESFRASFERLATEHGGEYDGWEASAKP
jgi:hypothetical protein